MDHQLFSPQSLEEAKHTVVGDCNGYTTQQRWDNETPLFAQAILRHLGSNEVVLDYGCGCGRLAKAILDRSTTIQKLIGVDNSAHQLRLAQEYVHSARFHAHPPEGLAETVDLTYCIYVLQHVPAIELREVLLRIYRCLRKNGAFICCSSIRRMAIRADGRGVVDDRSLGVDILAEIGRLFEPISLLFSPEDLASNSLVRTMTTSSSHPHPALIYRKRSVDIIAIGNFPPPAEYISLPQLQSRSVEDNDTLRFDKERVVALGRMYTPALMGVMRTLKRWNPSDDYLERYLEHYRQHGEHFFDHYSLAWFWGHFYRPRRILEIGSGSGISLIQLLSSTATHTHLQKVITCDTWEASVGGIDIVKTNLWMLNLPKHLVEFYQGRSSNLMCDLRTTGDKFDWILIDGNPDPDVAFQDLSNAACLAEIGGIIVFDDISPTGSGLLGVWETFKESLGSSADDFACFENLEGKGTGWAIRRR